MEGDKRLSRCCFTGHRPEKLKKPMFFVRLKLKKEILNAVEKGYTTFISGMSRGIDIEAAKIVLKLKKTNSNIYLICAVPYPDFEKRWDEYDKKIYRDILTRADLVKIISEHYFRGCYQVRNQWMVDRSNLVIAAYNGEKGGTKNTIDYAIRKNINVINILNRS